MVYDEKELDGDYAVGGNLMTQKNELDGYAAIGGKVMTKKNLNVDN